MPRTRSHSRHHARESTSSSSSSSYSYSDPPRHAPQCPLGENLQFVKDQRVDVVGDYSVDMEKWLVGLCCGVCLTIVFGAALQSYTEPTSNNADTQKDITAAEDSFLSAALCPVVVVCIGLYATSNRSVIAYRLFFLCNVISIVVAVATLLVFLVVAADVAKTKISDSWFSFFWIAFVALFVMTGVLMYLCYTGVFTYRLIHDAKRRGNFIEDPLRDARHRRERRRERRHSMSVGSPSRGRSGSRADGGGRSRSGSVAAIPAPSSHSHKSKHKSKDKDKDKGKHKSSSSGRSKSSHHRGDDDKKRKKKRKGGTSARSDASLNITQRKEVVITATGNASASISSEGSVVVLVSNSDTTSSSGYQDST